MTFTGTLIDDLMATVESAENRAQAFKVTEMEPSLENIARRAVDRFRSGKYRLRFQISWSGINYERRRHANRSSY